MLCYRSRDPSACAISRSKSRGSHPRRSKPRAGLQELCPQRAVISLALICLVLKLLVSFVPNWRQQHWRRECPAEAWCQVAWPNGSQRGEVPGLARLRGTNFVCTALLPLRSAGAACALWVGEDPTGSKETRAWRSNLCAGEESGLTKNLGSRKFPEVVGKAGGHDFMRTA